MLQGEGRASAHDSAVGRRAAEQRSLLVPCLRSGEDNLATTGAAGFWTTEGDRELHQQQGNQHKSIINAHDADSNVEAPPATNGERAVAGGEGLQADHRHEQDEPRIETTNNRLESKAEGQERRVTGMVEASVRAGDWVLPNRCGGDLASRGGGASLPAGKKGGGWLRVEAVSVA